MLRSFLPGCAPSALCACVVGGAFVAACGGDPPAAVVTLVLTEGVEIDADDVTGFLVQMGTASATISKEVGAQVPIAFEVPPPGPVTFAVYACKEPQTCATGIADFFGCNELDVEAGAAPEDLVVEVPLFPVEAPSAACAPILAGR